MKKSVYFFWDYDLDEEDVKAILRGTNETEKIWVMSRILQNARWHDIWKYLTLRDIQENFQRLEWRLPYFKELWGHALRVWGYAVE